jgi:hypothetical protein
MHVYIKNLILVVYANNKPIAHLHKDGDRNEKCYYKS